MHPDFSGIGDLIIFAIYAIPFAVACAVTLLMTLLITSGAWITILPALSIIASAVFRKTFFR